MWLILAFLSALLLGFYDVAKKQALRGNSVPAVLLLNTLFSSLIFLPSIVSALCGGGWFDGTPYQIPLGTAQDHLLVAAKAAIVLSSWAFGYYGIKNLPITIVGPINATRPVMVLLGAFIIFGERLNLLQWTGVALAVVSLFMLSRAGRREGIDFTHNVWIVCVAAAALLGAASGLYDRYLMQHLQPLFVQGWYNLYQLIIMIVAMSTLRAFGRSHGTAFHWSWAIPMISVLLTAADMVYFIALSDADALISVVSMIRRGSVVVSFTCGALLFRERNLRAKAVDMALIIIGMVFLYFGSR